MVVWLECQSGILFLAIFSDGKNPSLIGVFMYLKKIKLKLTEKQYTLIIRALDNYLPANWSEKVVKGQLEQRL